jgi:hypothetical protein
LGNSWTSSIQVNKTPLRVGDTYELLIEAVDPKNREIEYEVSFTSSGHRIVQNDNRFNIEITPNLIAQTTMLFISVRTPNAEYKNENAFQIVCTILPK